MYHRVLVPRSLGPLLVDGRPRQAEINSQQLADRRHPGHCLHGWRADPRTRRSGNRWDGYSGEQSTRSEEQRTVPLLLPPVCHLSINCADFCLNLRFMLKDSAVEISVAVKGY